MSSEKKMTGEEFIEESGNQTGPAVEAAPAAEEIRQGGIVTVMIMGIDSNPDRYTIEAPMPLGEFLQHLPQKRVESIPRWKSSQGQNNSQSWRCVKYRKAE